MNKCLLKIQTNNQPNKNKGWGESTNIQNTKSQQKYSN